MGAQSKACICGKLNGKAAEWYKEKIKAIGGVCPYEIDKADCSADPEDFPLMWHIGR